MNLPETYAAVCAKRPDLAVDSLNYGRGLWELTDDDCNWFVLNEPTAAALILARWVEALPAWFKLSKQDNSDHDDAINGVMWWVEDSIHGLREAYAPTPLEALAAYYLGETNG